MVSTKIGKEILKFLDTEGYDIRFSWVSRDDEGQICYKDKEIEINYILLLVDTVIFSYLLEKYPNLDPQKYDDCMANIFDELSDEALFVISSKADSILNKKKFILPKVPIYLISSECVNIIEFLNRVDIIDQWTTKKTRDSFKNSVINFNIDIAILEVFLYHWLLWKNRYDPDFKFSENDVEGIIQKMTIKEIKELSKKILDKIV